MPLGGRGGCGARALVPSGRGATRVCGIAGIRRPEGAVDRAVLARMARSLRHRGPDDSGIYASGPVGLAHTRLSIIDLSVLGRQPMACEANRFVIVYNGEIYNHLALRTSLEDQGHTFRGRSDTEVALRAYMEWGESAFEMFEGMFAIAIWDEQRRILQLARDRFGIKPLYFGTGASGAVVFGSEVKAILASGEIAPETDWAGLHEYLYFDTALGSNTLFRGIAKVLPGQLVTVLDTGITRRRFASILDAVAVADDLPTARRTVQGLLEDAVKSHLMSDVPVGVFLSGGIDSSAIVAFAARHYGSRINTYAVGFDSVPIGSVNELPAARAVADHFDTNHHEVRVSGRDVTDVMERLVRCHDEPFGDAADIPLYMLCEQLRGEMKVVLQGDGGDEVFAGYTRYAYLAHVFWLRLLSRSTYWLHPVARHLPGRRGLRALRALGQYSRADPAMCLARLVSTELPDRPSERIFSAAVRAQLARSDAFRRYRELSDRVAARDPVTQMLYTDSSILLPDVYFEKVDKSTMAHGVEVRVPMVDTRLAAYVFGLPRRYKVRGLQKKYVLREALRGIVPDSILDRPKAGFGVPVSSWLRTSLVDYMKSVLFDAETQDLELFDRRALELCIREHVDQRRDNGPLLYKALNLALWCKAYRPTFVGLT